MDIDALMNDNEDSLNLNFKLVFINNPFDLAEVNESPAASFCYCGNKNKALATAESSFFWESRITSNCHRAFYRGAT